MTSQMLNESDNYTELVCENISALRKLQFEVAETDAELHRAIWDLECRFQERFQEIYKKRDAIVNSKTGAIGSSGSDSKCPQAADVGAEEAQGIPDFWLNVLKNSGTYLLLVHDDDLPILKYLNDLRVQCRQDPDMSFTLEFHFGENPYFHNEVLTKKYFMSCKVDPDNPFVFDGPEIHRSRGCEINWKGNYAETVEQSSFFNFFETPEMSVPASDDEIDELRTLLQADYEMGLFIKEQIVPKAACYYLKEEFLYEEFETSSTDSTDIEEEYESETIGDAQLLSE